MNEDQNIEPSANERPQSTENINENISESSTITQQPQTEEMEVHKHPHHVMHKKKWSEYLLEFFMLFFAVFLGFVAENIRENRVNSEIEKRNIESFISNLKKDSINLARVTKNFQMTLDDIDSLSKVPGEFSDTSFQKDFFHFATRLIYLDSFDPDESAFQQMQSSGSLRLIKHANVTDSILKYHAENEYIKEQAVYMDTWYKLSTQDLCRLADFRNGFKQKPLKLIGSYAEMQEYINYKIAESLATKGYLWMLKRQLINIKIFIPFLQKEYHLQNE